MKEPLVMLPGTLCDDALFKHQIEGLKKFADCQIGNISSADDLKLVASNIIEKVNGNFALLGLSYGGIIAFEIWRQVPNRVNRMILLNTNHKKPSDETRANQQRFLGMSVLDEFREVTTDFLKDAMLHPDHAKDLELRQIILNMAIKTGRVNFTKQIKAQLNRPDSTVDLPNISCPTLVITGKQDKVCTPEIHKEIARLIPNASLRIINNCGHLSTLEQPGIVNHTIIDWWENT